MRTVIKQDLNYLTSVAELYTRPIIYENTQCGVQGRLLVKDCLYNSIPGTRHKVYQPCDIGTNLQFQTDVILNLADDINLNSVTVNILTISTMTPGSVLFAGVGGLVSQDNTNLFWDDAQNRLGINTNTPDYSLDVAGEVGIDDYLHHNGDPDTYFYFSTDRIIALVGNEYLFDLYEGAQDYIKLGDGGDVDINLNDDITIDGATGSITFAHYGLGIIHSSAGGVLTSSAIVNGDLGNLGTAGTLAKFGATGLADSLLSETANDVIIGSTKRFGLGAGKGGLTFTDAAIDTITFDSCNVAINTTASAVLKLYIVNTNNGEEAFECDVTSINTAVSGALGFSLCNVSATTNNWAGFNFCDAAFGVASAQVASQFTDRVNHYGTLSLLTRRADGCLERFKIRSDGNSWNKGKMWIGTTEYLSNAYTQVMSNTYVAAIEPVAIYSGGKAGAVGEGLSIQFNHIYADPATYLDYSGHQGWITGGIASVYGGGNYGGDLWFQVNNNVSLGGLVTVMKLTYNGYVRFPIDGVVTSYGVDSEVTLTHVHNTGLLLNTTMALQFRDSALYISSKNDGYLDFDADTAFRFNAGNVGIGTTAPNLGSVSKALTISAGTSGINQAFLELQGSRNGETNKVFGGIDFYNGLNNTATIGGVRETADDDGALSFYTKKTLVSLSEKMRITGDGNVGIGTTAPLLNVGSATGDFTGMGLHIKAPTDTKAFLILEGRSWYDNGGHSASQIIFADMDGAANTKMFALEQGINTAGDVLYFKSLNDNTSTKKLVMNLDGGNQFITHYHATKNVIWKDAVVADWNPGETARGRVLINVDGTDRWVPFYAIPT